MSDIQFWRSGGWTMVYKDGRLQLAGDHYRADEWLQELCNVTVVDDEAGVCIPDGHNALKTLAEVHVAEEAREERMRAAYLKREQASNLLAEAVELEAQK
jgi:hypothetical protein